MTNQTKRYEVRHRPGYSNCDDMAGIMLSGITIEHSAKKDAIQAMKDAESNAPEVASRMGAPRIAVWDSRDQKYIA